MLKAVLKSTSSLYKTETVRNVEVAKMLTKKALEDLRFCFAEQIVHYILAVWQISTDAEVCFYHEENYYKYYEETALSHSTRKDVCNWH